MRYFLTKLRIEGFRGINNDGTPLELRFKTDAINSVFAPNGLGKSSIFDALCYAIRGGIPKLDGLPAAEKANDYYCNRFHSTGIAVIHLTFTPDQAGPDVVIQIQRTRDGRRTVTSPSGEKDPEAFLQTLNEDFALLDYSTFAHFIEDSPLDRGRSFSSLLGMARLSQARQVLKMLADGRNLESDFGLSSLKTEKSLTTQDIANALRDARLARQKLLGIQPTEPMDADAVALAGTAALTQVPLIAPYLKDKTLLTADYEAIQKALREADDSKGHEQLATILNNITLLESLAPTADESKEIAALRRHITSRDNALAKTRGPLTKAMYEGVQAVLGSDEWTDDDRCPACESTPSTPPKELVAARLAQYDEVSKHQQEVVAEWSAATSPKRFTKLEHAEPLGVPQEERRFPALDAQFRTQTPTHEDVRAFSDKLQSLDAARENIAKKLAEERDRLRKDLPASLVTLTEQVQSAKDLRDALKELTSQQQKEATLDYKIRRRELWKNFVDIALATFQLADSQFSKTRAASLKTSYQGMFASIVAHGQIVPSLQQSGTTEDLQFRLDEFFGKRDFSATPLLSESYRNAAGLAIFLSAALESSAAPRFIVLDDVTSSFDAGHQFQLMELLRVQVGIPENPSGLQVILLSHDGLLEKYFDRLSNTKGWHHYKLQGLPPTGSVLTQAQGPNRLRDDAERFLKAGQIKQGEPLIRQYLEFKLIQIITRVRIPVPLDFAIRDSNRVVSNSLEAIEYASRLHEKAGDLILDDVQRKAINSVHAPALLANWVAHYETGSSSSLASHVLLSVLKSIDEFADCFCYSCSCDGSPRRRYYKSLSAKACDC